MKMLKMYVIGIKDTGSGIHAEIMPKLFSKFASKSFSGTGLGLYISKSIVEAHGGGKIWAENNTDGKELHLVLVFHLIEQRIESSMPALNRGLNLLCLHQFLPYKSLTVVVKTHIQVIVGPG